MTDIQPAKLSNFEASFRSTGVLEPNDQLREWISDDGIYGAAVFDATEAHRYVLIRRWDLEFRTQSLRVIGLNPSTATERILDPTIRRLIGYARLWGYGGLMMLNLFSLRSTDPKALYDTVKRGNASAATGDPANYRIIEYICEPPPLLHVATSRALAAWGNHGALINRGKEVCDRLGKAGVSLDALSVTGQGQPIHALYQPLDATPKPYTEAQHAQTLSPRST